MRGGGGEELSLIWVSRNLESCHSVLSSQLLTRSFLYLGRRRGAESAP